MRLAPPQILELGTTVDAQTTDTCGSAKLMETSTQLTNLFTEESTSLPPLEEEHMETTRSGRGVAMLDALPQLQETQADVRAVRPEKFTSRPHLEDSLSEVIGRTLSSGLKVREDARTIAQPKVLST